MKGIVFTEFMVMVEGQWGMEMVDRLIDDVDPDSKGVYTTVGTYEYSELVDYITTLHGATGLEVSKLIYTFGRHLAASFSTRFSGMFEDAQSTLELLKKVDNHIHVEVKKLYPDAELPRFSYVQTTPHNIVLRYESARQLADLAQGLIEGCAEYFGENIQLTRKTISEDDESVVDFSIELLPK